MSVKSVSDKASQSAAKVSSRSAQLALAGARRSVVLTKNPPPASEQSEKAVPSVTDSFRAAREADRLVVGSDGKLMYASPAMAKMLGLKDTASLSLIAFRDLIQFTNPEDALRDRPMFSADDETETDLTAPDAWLTSIVSGEHEIVPLAAHRAKPVSLRFDHVVLPEGRRYLIISSAVRDETISGDNDAVLSFLAGLMRSAESKTPASVSDEASERDARTGLLSSLVDMGREYMLVLSSRGKILQSNAVFFETLGVSEESLLGKSFLDLVAGEDKPYIQPIFKTLMQDGRESDCAPIPFECRIRGEEKTTRWLDCRIRSAAGKLLLVAQDLTDSKRHESELLRREQQLSEAQSIGHMGHWIWRVGDDKLEFSSELYRIFGVTDAEFTPTIDTITEKMHRRDRGRMTQAFQRAMIERKNYEMEFRVIRPSGEVRYIVLQGRCETDEEGDVSALFGIMQDVTERNQHERELREAKESAERAYAAKSQFLANMSHELRTPLNAIIGFSEMIGRQMLGPIGTEKYLEYITGIRESGEHLLDLITDILDMSKIEAGKYTLDLEEFNLYKVVRLASHMIEGRALDAQVRVLTSIPETDNLPIVGDRRAIMQMVLNILSNAVKFTRPGGEVRIACTVKEPYLVLQFTDTGIGIPANKLRYVTKPFEQAANSFTRNHEGTGLGLAITKELAELHGGKLELASTVGVGTVVTVTLPLRAGKG